MFRDLETERLFLKSISHEDDAFFYKQFSSEEVNRYLYDAEPCSTIAEAAEWIDFYLEEPRNQHRWILTLKSTGESIGTCGFHRWNRKTGEAEIGYDLWPTYWRQGYTYEAVGKILDSAAKEMGVKKVFAHISVDNAASVRTALKLGFVRSGEQYYEEFHGQKYLHDIYVKLLSEDAIVSPSVKTQERCKMLIETERLIITEFTPDMAQAVQENSVDEDNKRFVPDEVWETAEEAEETLEFLIAQYGAFDGPLVYPIIVKETKDNIGYVQLCPIDDGKWEIGYHIAKKYTGNGYATEAVKAFLPVIAERAVISEVYGICLAQNSASLAVMKKSGFQNIFTGIGLYQGIEREIIKNVWRKNQ